MPYKGLTQKEVVRSRELHGENCIASEKKISFFRKFSVGWGLLYQFLAFIFGADFALFLFLLWRMRCLCLIVVLVCHVCSGKMCCIDFCLELFGKMSGCFFLFIILFVYICGWLWVLRLYLCLAFVLCLTNDSFCRCWKRVSVTNVIRYMEHPAAGVLLFLRFINF